VHHTVEAHINTHRMSLQTQPTNNDSISQGTHILLQGTDLVLASHTVDPQSQDQQVLDTRHENHGGPPIHNAGIAPTPLHLSQPLDEPSADRYLIQIPGLL
jgi:hypothetical protein